MANRQTRLITKNSPIVNRPLPSSLLPGEAIVNTADGIVFYSGVTTSTPEWTQAGTGSTSNFFEVGSNLYDLQLRNQITKYQGQSGSNLEGKFLSGTTSGFVLANIVDINTFNGLTLGSLNVTGTTSLNDLTVTGITNLGATTATTIDANTIYSGGTDLYTLVTGWDVYVTGFTYNPGDNTFTIKRNRGKADLTAQISSVTGLTISTLGSNRVVYTTNSGQLTTESGFEYNQTGNTLTVGNINVQNASGTTANIGQGGLVIGSGGSLLTSGVGDLTVHGDLTVFGTTTTVATNELYVEDPQITLNYSTGSTTSTSVSSGVKIQDGNGLASGDTYFTIGQMQNLTGLTPTQVPSISEYTGLTGYVNRGWVTQLNDIVIRNTNKNEGSPNGVRVLAEFDVLDGGSY